MSLIFVSSRCGRARPSPTCRESPTANWSSAGYQAVDSPKRIGHGIGMSRAEPPSLNEVETELYRPGMVLALEPKVRSEKSAVHLEEDVLITEKARISDQRLPRFDVIN